MSFNRYPIYKKSEAGWMFDVPEHWKLLPCRGFVDERTEKNEDASCQSYLSLMANVGVIPYEEKGDIGNKKPDDLSKCKIVHQGDFVINSMNYGIGSYGVSAYEGVCSPVYIVLRPKSEVVEPGFAFRVFEDKSFQAYAQSFGNGILAHRCSIGWDDLKGIAVGIPPAEEQKSILNFLDRETAKIDALIAEQARMIELLQEKRQAVISHAVTKGLNPNAPMKDSGVEWLGEVPAHWVVTRLGFLCSKIGSGKTPLGGAEAYRSDGILFIRSQNVYDEGLYLEDAAFISEETDAEQSWSRVLPGDLLLNITGASLGRTCLVPDDFRSANVNQHVCIIRLRSAAHRGFASMMLKSAMAKSQFDAVQNGAAREGINFSQISKLQLVMPPEEEQVKITEFLECETARFDVLVSTQKHMIELLEERRSSLISAAVTGQIDVRDLGSKED